jgi:hypothetical protein
MFCYVLNLRFWLLIKRTKRTPDERSGIVLTRNANPVQSNQLQNIVVINQRRTWKLALKAKKDIEKRMKNAQISTGQSGNCDIAATSSMQKSKTSVTSTRSSSRNRKTSTGESESGLVGPGLPELTSTNGSVQPVALTLSHESKEKNHDGRVRTSTRLKILGSNGKEKSVRKREVSFYCFFLHYFDQMVKRG